MIKIKVSQIKVPIRHNMEDVIKKAQKKANFKRDDLIEWNVSKKSIDSRKEPVYVYAVEIKLKKYNTSKTPKDVSIVKKEVVYEPNITGQLKLNYNPVVVGFGPAGMFCSYLLAKTGYSPIILERGKMVEERVKDVEAFWNGAKLNEESNIQFGEGGAGTFSDGKLNTGIKDRNGRQKFVLETFVKFGAPESILYDSKPHIGTDILCDVVKNMRKDIIANGGKFLFESKLTNIVKSDDGVYELEINNKEKIKTQLCVLAIGHSARDTFEMLYENNYEIRQKPFAIGVRVEHKQKTIDKAQYGIENNSELPPSSYKLTYTTKEGRGVYSFCMCPGGYVVNAASEEGTCVVNGMSYSKRSGENANSAIVTTITPKDFGSEHPLAGVRLQRMLEKKAYEEGNGKIPIQLYKDFVQNRKSTAIGKITPNIKGQYSFGNIKNILPEYICSSIEEAMPHFGRDIEGFNDENVIFSAVESRTSSPVRIVRNETYEATQHENVYPCGEGAGYAGGITSAAIDGVKVYEQIATKYSN